jgi:hypothetical protein
LRTLTRDSEEKTEARHRGEGVNTIIRHPGKTGRRGTGERHCGHTEDAEEKRWRLRKHTGENES